ncbi:MAG: AzlD domain-containing protein [Deltaproteobacteria bacterium]|nr:AzlD domain-containing protein [Deltaproteobacteria bacterium]
MSTGRYLLLVAGMGLVTFLPRWLPLLVLSRRPLPRWLAEWLDLLPAAILAALVVPALVAPGATRELDLGRSEFLAAVPTLVVALRTRSLAATVILGMALYWLAERLL